MNSVKREVYDLVPTSVWNACYDRLGHDVIDRIRYEVLIPCSDVIYSRCQLNISEEIYERNYDASNHLRTT